MVVSLKFEAHHVKPNVKWSHNKNIRLPRSFLVTFFVILLLTGFVAFSRRQFEMVIQSHLMSQDHYLVIDTVGSVVSATLLSVVAVAIIGGERTGGVP